MLPKRIQNIVNLLPVALQNLIGEITRFFEQQLAAKDARIQELEDQLSKNSSKPPSSDAPYEKPSPKSRRTKSNKKPGGQPKHKGHNLKMVAEPDQVIVHEVSNCHHCGADLSDCPVSTISRRQVYDIPPIKIQVTEHQIHSKDCGCGQTTQADVPSHISHYVQYGPTLKGLLVYLQNYQLLPYERTAELVKDLFDHDLSQATLYNSQQYAFRQLADFEKSLKTLLSNAEIAGFDETGFRVNTQCSWLHSCSTDQHAYYEVHHKRGNEAMDAIGILPHFEGIAIHDFWKSYLKYDCTHGLCNAHLLRELQFISQRFKQAWADDLAALLCQMKTAKDQAIQQGKTTLASAVLQDYQQQYTQIIERGLLANPFIPPKIKKRGRPAKTKARNLLERMRDYKDDIIRFLFDFKVPFDNNFSERDIRMMKLKQKISGCFRLKKGAQYFARIRSYIMTARKQGMNAFDALVQLFSDNQVYSKLINSS